ncbi:hypothetical protein GCM10010517_09370 [Streptosporangium fragile]|uniref:WD40 repeat domain-containing protein n=1 Tax=Streptosporangium fragile TaxID=46186 RepID=A0ABN3VTX8_9ACTN
MKHRALAAGAALAVSAALTATPALAAAPAGPAAPASYRTAPVAGAVYFGYRGGGVEVQAHRGGWTRHTVGGAGFAGQFAVAPDGLRVAWIDDKGRLHVRAGSADKVIAKDAAYGGPCLTPAWTADGRRLVYPVKGGTTATTVAVVGSDGKGRSDAGKTLGPCHLTWSADGRTLAGYAGDTDGVHLLDTRTRVSGRVPGIKLANHVESLSPDARRVVVNAIGANAPGGDGSWPLTFTPSIHDTRTGKKIAIPVKGRLLGARYLRDGRLAVRVKGATANTLVVLSASGKELQRLAEPARARALGLVGVLE